MRATRSGPRDTGMDIELQVEYWRCGSEEDFAAAHALLEKGHPRQALFLAHLAIEKLLKAHVCRATPEFPPRTHDLLRLADLAGLPLTPERRVFLARFQKYCLEGRYPDRQPPVPPAEAQTGLREAQEMLTWLTSLLS